MSAPSPRFRGVVWLDRDGTVVDDPGYLDDPRALVLLDGVVEAIAELNRRRVAVVLITNQSGIARGLMPRSAVDAIHEALQGRLRAGGAHLDGIYLCPHLPGELLPEVETPCNCRKPEPGLVRQATEELGLQGIPGVVVGDKPADLELGARLGVPALLVLTGEGERTRAGLAAREGVRTPVAADLSAALPWILQSLGIAP